VFGGVGFLFDFGGKRLGVEERVARRAGQKRLLGEGDPEPVARALGLRPGEGEGNVYLLSPYDQGVFYAPLAKGGLPVVCLPQLYADLHHYERRRRDQAAHLRREAMGY
jgi:hypothetical protein